MKKRFLTWFVLWFCIAAQAQDYKEVQPGIEHARIVRQVKLNDKESAPVVVNLLRLNLKKVRLDVVHAKDRAIGLETTGSIATRRKAAAAINGGFFRLDKSEFAGDAVGVLQIDNKLLSESINDRITLGISNRKKRTRIEFGHLKSFKAAGFGANSELVFSGINRERKSDDIILYTPEFNQTTMTNDDGTEIILKDCQNRCRQIEAIESKGNSTIPPGGYVISIGKNAFEKANNVLLLIKKSQAGANDLENVAIVTRYSLPEITKSAFFEKTEDIITGVPQLIRNGKIEITWQAEKAGEKFVTDRHPRTAIAKLKNNRALLVTVDGRQAESVGMTLPELAEMLFEMKAVEAMNLDGGGSTTMFLNGSIVNKPSDKTGERAVSDAILVTLRK